MLVSFAYGSSPASIQPFWPKGFANRGKYFGVDFVAAFRMGGGEQERRWPGSCLFKLSDVGLINLKAIDFCS